MIGGNDIVFPAVGDAAALEACVRIVCRFWPQARFEDAVSGDKYQLVGEIPFGNVRELLVYPDLDAEKAWDADSPNAAENSMLYLIIRRDDLTVVLDNPQTRELQSILNAIRDMLWSDITMTYARAA